MPGRVRRGVLALSFLSLLGGCVAPGAEDDGGAGSPADAARLAAEGDAALAAFDRFRVRGGLGIWNDEQSLSARIDWRQRGEALDVELAAPLGLGTARLTRADGRATLERGDAPPLVGDSADTVLQRALGLGAPVPLDQLALWLRGLPGDGREVRRDAAGRLESLRWTDAAGTNWQARILDRTTLDGLSLPRLVTANGAGYRMRLVLREWSAEPSDGEGGGAEAGDGASGEGTGDAGGTVDAPRRLSIPGRR